MPVREAVLNQHLAAHVFAADVDGDIVLLDAAEGAYYCLADAAEGFDLSTGARRVRDPDLALALSELALTSRDPTPARAPPSAPARQLAVPEISLSWREQRDAVLSYGDMLHGYYGRTFARVLSVTRLAPKHSPAATASADLTRRVAAFRRWLPWAPFPGVCLFRSRMLLSYLRRGGLDAAWIIGVRTWPFEAHCWLQAGDLVLDDTLDNVRSFRPIHWVNA